jgi:hypothetical protein
MKDEAALEALEGKWRGRTKLIVPNEEERESSIRLRVRRFAGESFIRIGYRWKYDGQEQDGLLALCLEMRKERWVGVWADSWHMSNTFMQLEGRLGIPIELKGSYEAGPGQPHWGWRIQIDPASSRSLTIKMWNVTPGGEEQLAVDSALKRE